jgi:adenylylsulfate reductase subunit B
MPPVVNMDSCNLCGTCADICPGDVLRMNDNGPVIIYPDECWHCGSCRTHCPTGAISYKFPLSMMI